MRAVFEKIRSDDESLFSVLEIDQREFGAPWHFHPECELTFISEGSGDRFAGDSMESFEAGDLVLLGANLPHYWRSRKREQGKSRAVVVHFDEDFPGKNVADKTEFSGIRKMLKAARQGLCFSGEADLSQRIGGRLHDLSAEAGLKRLLVLLEILDDLDAAADTAKLLSSRGYIPFHDQKAAQRINRACEYVYANLSDKITLPAVSQVAGMSPAAFSRYFKRMAGRNLSHFIGEVRISRACKLLRETDLGIAEIAYEVGFGSLSNFNRLFKSLKRKSPREWRAFDQ